MKRNHVFFVFILIVLVSVILFSEQSTLNFQGMLQDADGIPVNDTKMIEFRIYDDLTAGTQLWSELHYSVNIEDGLFAVELGNDTAFPADLFAGDELFITFFVGGEEITPRQKFLPVPFSIRSYQAANADTSAYAATLEGVALSGVVQQDGDGNATISGTMTADAYVGDGSGLSGITQIYDDTYLHKVGPDTMTANSEDAVLSIQNQSDTGDGIFVSGVYNGLNVNNSSYGVTASGTQYSGFLSFNTISGYQADQILWNGFQAVQIGTPTAMNYNTENPAGFVVNGSEGNGLWVGRADMDGVYVNSAGVDGVQVNFVGDNFFQAGQDGSEKFYVNSSGSLFSESFQNISFAAGGNRYLGLPDNTSDPSIIDCRIETFQFNS
ncbi:MAG: hypothetical protein K9N09_08420 [Candidatus Cloacimonetes bacterium]|nr:hypothetical protein [Candidatus Cloacimonadota bacterium]MCF7813508.1 hypothetical protein [Candidatus Cloacimonadota bacterium]MCF7868708.1 hypothetical protein [Candidatus Cloacimonadota bacterium]MCF7884674.1 hypothetical protein [Candidatus Cloacimonadota bacterium]